MKIFGNRIINPIINHGGMVLTKGHRVWRKLKPRSALLECKDVTDGALLFESDSVATLCEHVDS